MNFFAFVGLTSYGGVQYAHRQSQMSNGTIIETTPFDSVEILHIAGATGVATGVVIVFAVLWLWLSRSFARQLIVATIVLNVLVWLAGAGVYVWLAASHDVSWYPAIAFAVAALLHACLYFLWRKHIPFAAALLSTVGKVSSRYGGTLVTSYVSLIVLLGWSTVASFAAVVTATGSWMPQGGAAYAVYVYVAFSFFWTQQVIRNTSFVTISGTFASWYFLGGNVGMAPSNPTLGSAKRALTTSFGSICLGSLLVAIVQTLRAIVRSMRSRRNSLLLCLVDCLLGCIESLMRLFNKYAFALVAIFGGSYCQSAKKCASLVSSHGIAALINQSIINSVLGFGCMFGGLLGFGAGTAAGFLFLGMPVGLEFIFLVPGVLGMLIGVVTMSQLAMVIDSGVATIFVAFAMEPQALQQNDPQLYEHFAGAASLM